MRKVKFSRKLLALILAVVMLISSFPATFVYAAESDDLGTVNLITPGGSIDKDDPADIKVSFSDLELEWSEADTSVGRNVDGWWVGINMTAPKAYGKEVLQFAKYQNWPYTAETWSDEVKEFWKFKDSPDSDEEDAVHYITLWAFVDVARLINAIQNSEEITTQWHFDWNNDKTYEQTVSIIIDPASVELKQGDDSVYPLTQFGSVSVLTLETDAEVAGNESAFVKVSYKNDTPIILDWSKEDSSALREKDGWWVGIKLTAPDGIDVAGVSFKRQSFGGEWSQAESFDEYKDSEKEITLWGYIDEALQESGETITTQWQFDWDKDGVFEQLIVLEVDPDRFELSLDNLYAEDKLPPAFGDVAVYVGEAPKENNDWINTEETVTIKGTVSDAEEKYASGIDSLSVKDDKGQVTQINIGETGEFSYDVDADIAGTYTLTVTDKSGKSTDKEVPIKLDRVKPELSPDITVSVDDMTVNADEWVNKETGNVVISGTASDDGSGISKVEYKKADAKEWETADFDEANGEFSFTIDEEEYAGAYIIRCVDKAGTESDPKFISVQIDKVFCIVVEDDVTVESSDWTNENVTISGTVEDNTSGVASVTYKLPGGTEEKAADVTYTTDDKKNAKFEIVISPDDVVDGINVIQITFTDFAGNVKSINKSIQIDTTPPEIDSVELSNANWTNEDVTISGKVSDVHSGVSRVEIYFGEDKETGSLFATIDADKLGTDGEFSCDVEALSENSGIYSIYAYDVVGNVTEESKQVDVKVDNVAPIVSITTDQPLAFKLLDKITFGLFNKITFGFFNFVEVTVTVKEDLSGLNELTVTDSNGKVFTLNVPTETVEDGMQVSTYTFIIDYEFKDQIKAVATDIATNSGEADKINSESDEYDGIIVDTTAPEPNNGYIYVGSPYENNDKIYFNKDLKIGVQIKENYFFEDYYGNAKDAKTEAKNAISVLAEKVSVKITKDDEIYYEGTAVPTGDDKALFEAELKIEKTNDYDGIIYLTIPATLKEKPNDGVYTVTFTYNDLANHSVDVPYPYTLVIDTTAPEVEITAEQPLGYKLLSKLTFGLFNKANITVTVKDNLSGLKNLDVVSAAVGNGKGVFEALNLTAGDAVSETYDGEAQTTIFEFTIDNEYRDSIKATATDNLGWKTAVQEISDENGNYDGVIVDTTAPVIDGEIEYSGSVNSLGDKHYYSGDATAVFSVDEEYFYENYYATADDAKSNKNPVNALENDIDIKIEKTSHASGSVSEIYYEGKAVSAASTGKFNVVFNEAEKTISVTIPAVVNGVKNDGDYVITLSYTDIADNFDADASTAVTEIMVIDTTNPTINVEYTPHINGNYANEDASAVNYFKGADRSAVITVNEHNFTVDEIVVSITAKDINGKDIKQREIDNIIAAIHNEANWKIDENNSNIHIFEYAYLADANYTFSISTKDLALNSNDAVTYKNAANSNADAPEGFTVDNSEPTDIKIGFFKTALSKILNVLTFGVFFNDEIKVRIEANDNIAGLWKAEIEVKDRNGKQVSVFDESVKLFEELGKSKANGFTEFVITKDKLDIIKNFQGTICIKIYDNSGNCYENRGEINNGSITLTSSVKPINDNEKEIDNYLVFESGTAHKAHSSISIKPAQNAVSTQTKQTAVDFKEYLREECIKDADMAFKKSAPLYSDKVEYTVDFLDDYSGVAKAQIIVYNNNTGAEYINSTYDLIDGSVDSNKVTWSNSKSASNKKVVEKAKATFTVTQNANDIVILALITDNAGNMSYDYYNFGIDTTKPAIDYSFEVDQKSVSNGSYYNKEATFTVNVSDRNFPVGNEIVGTITYKVNGVSKSVTVKGKDFAAVNNANVYSDNQKYTCTISSFKAEGQYEEFVFEAVDRAGNNHSVKPSMTFFYDYTAPVIKIVNDEYSTLNNGKFYQDKREITVTVTDRYFSEKSFTYNNVAGSYQFVSDSEAGERYHTNNRTFTYVFTYETNTSIDCSLTQFAAIDFAKNSAVNVPAVENSADFVIDGKAPDNFSAVVTTPSNQNGVIVSDNLFQVFVEDDITLVITIRDENISLASISNAILTCKSLMSNGETKDVDFTLKKVSGTRDTLVYSVSNLDQDGFYEITYQVTDDSGKVSAAQTASFAICRNGAMYNKEALDEISDNEEMYNADTVSDITFEQYSASANTYSVLEISSQSVQFPRRVLELGVDYILVSEPHQDGEMTAYKAVYKLLRHAFELENGAVLDGVYTITITPVTLDANNNTSDNAPFQTFTVTLDATVPVLAANLDYITSYNKVYEGVVVETNSEHKMFAAEATLNFSLSDSYSGIDESSVVVAWNGEALNYETDGNGNYSVILSSKHDSNGNAIVISAKDKAGNDVSTSFTVKLDSNFWLYVALVALALVAAIAIFVILIRKRKKND